MKTLENIKTIDVDTGEIRVTSDAIILQSIALGSCVALVLYDRMKKIGGIAHIMLPGKSLTGENSNKFAENAIYNLLDLIEAQGAVIASLEISIVGGANVLQEGDIPDKVIDSVLGYLMKLDIKLKYMRVGGILRRSVFLHTKTGDVYYTEGNDMHKKLLHKMERI